MAGKRNQEEHERKMGLILDAAGSVLVSEGPGEVDRKRVGRLLPGAGFACTHYFPNGATMLAAVLERHVRGLLEAVRQPEDWPGSPAERLAAMAVAYAARAAGTAGVHAALPGARTHLLPVARDNLAAMLRWVTHAFGEAIAEAVPAARMLEARREALAGTLLAMLDSHPAWSGWQSVPHEAHARACVAMLRGAEGLRVLGG